MMGAHITYFCLIGYTFKSMNKTQSQKRRKRWVATGVITLSSALFAFADIYMYIDDKGGKHFVNHYVQNAELVKKVSPIIASDDQHGSDTQTLLEMPRFNRTPSVQDQQVSSFQGNFPNRYLLGPERKPAYLENFTQNHKAKSELVSANFANRSIYTPFIDQIAKEIGVPPALVHAVISVESAYNPKARSHVGAQGLMQLMPMTAKRFGVVDAYDPLQNIRGGTTYLKFLLEKFEDVELALAGYNAGEGAVMRYGNKIPPFKETQNYVPRVMAYYYRYLKQEREARLYGRY